jgi:tetratricopeptide (TPR) repeat protein
MVAITVDSREDRLKWSFAAIDLAEKSEDERCRHWLGSIYNNVGWDYHETEQYDTALTMFQKALAAREAEGDESLTDIARWCVARCYRSSGRVDDALGIQSALYAKHEKAGTSDGYVCEELGELYLMSDRQDEASKYFVMAYESLSKDSWLVENEPDRLKRMRDLAGIKED